MTAAGRTRIHLRETGETFSHVPPNSKAHNVVVGGVWVDCYGHFSIVNTGSGAQCSLEFKPCGWFSYGRYEVRCVRLLAGMACTVLGACL